MGTITGFRNDAPCVTGQKIHAGDGYDVRRTGHVRVDSGRGQNRTLRGMASFECAIDGWS